MHAYVRWFTLHDTRAGFDVTRANFYPFSLIISFLSTSSSDLRPLPVNPGDFIYFPDRYWHATINLDPYTVFVSTFTTEHQEEQLVDEL